MLWKIYILGIFILVFFSAYYQFVITQHYTLLDTVNNIANFILLAGGYSYVFKKTVLPSSQWKLVYKILLVLLGANILYQMLPTSFVGDYSFVNANLFTNIFAYLVVTAFFVPLYYAVYLLSQMTKTSPKKKRSRA